MTSWAQVAKCWKVDNGDDFDAKALELYFPAAKDHEGAEARKAIWKSMDNNNNKYVSLAEYDGWFNQSRSPRFEVLRCLHAIDATRVYQTRSWVVLYSILSEFGRDSSDAPRRSRIPCPPTTCGRRRLPVR